MDRYPTRREVDAPPRPLEAAVTCPTG